MELVWKVSVSRVGCDQKRHWMTNGGTLSVNAVSGAERR